jgi:dihydrofolate synthase / folylpolyglutamate synthase
VREQLRWLASLQGSGIRPGLDRMQRLLSAAGEPQHAIPSVIVAGTNGKGSTAATLAAILHASGLKTGFYSSPHLISLRERWRVAECDVRPAVLRASIDRLKDLAEQSGIVPTYFEALTLVAFLIFEKEACDLSILEVGMGGRLDATNVTRPLLALITSIGLDHMEFLGSSLEEVAAEKSGVIHSGTVVITANTAPRVVDVIRRRCRETGSPFHRLADEVSASVESVSPGRMRLQLTTPDAIHSLCTPLVGSHQVDNVALAVRGAELLSSRFERVSKQAIEQGVVSTRWRGRMESFELEGKTFFVDGAHNPDGARHLAAAVEQLVPRPRTLVFGILHDKDPAAVAGELFPHFDLVIATEPPSDRAAPPSELLEIAGRLGVRAIRRKLPAAAMSQALRAPHDAIVVAGSLYLAGSAIRWLDRRIARNAASPSRKVETSKAPCTR